MKHVVACPLLALLWLVSAYASDKHVPAFFVLDPRGGEAFDQQTWETAIKAWDGEPFVRTYWRGSDDSAIQKARDDVARAGTAENLVLLMTATMPAKDSREFRASLDQVTADPAFKHFTLLAAWPMCALAQQRPGNYASGMPATMLFALDHPQARAICYPLVQTYYATPPGPDGKRIAPISIDGSVVKRQAVLPPMKLVRKMLADEAEFKRGNLVERPTSIYGRGESIFIYAAFDNVGRNLVGTPMANFEIGLDIEVRDRAGKVLKTFPHAHTYKGVAPPPFPANLDYFTNYATGDIHLNEPADYTITYIFHDRSRSESPPVAAEFDVTVN